MLILASRSASRQAMLQAAGVPFMPVPADLDERGIGAALEPLGAAAVALELARAKAGAVASRNAGRVVLGSDSLVVCDGRRFDKPGSREEAAEHLAWFSGRTMELHSGAALVRDDAVLFEVADVARLRVRALSPAFITHYLDEEWPDVGQCVGVFRIEGPGVNLFESIEGSHFTVLGMPLLPVLGALREAGVMPR